VAQLAADGRVENVVSFASGELRYAAVTCNGERVEADLKGNEIVISVPADRVVEWAGSDLVGIEDSQAVRDGELHILIEKDFACLKASRRARMTRTHSQIRLRRNRDERDRGICAQWRQVVADGQLQRDRFESANKHFSSML
jgi:hypothetical protein